TGGWDLHEIRTVQDFYVKYGLSGVDGVSEVASIGGYVQEYQVDVNPDALKVYDIPLHKVMLAVKKSNRDVGAKTIEINQAEYLVRGLGYIKSVEDLEKAVVAVHDNVPIRIKDIGVVSLGPASRRGLLDKDGAEVVGGVVVARYGSNPLQVINNVKDKLKEIAPGLPRKTLANGIESQLTIVPFYDRTQLIHETLGTLEEALSLEMLITLLVVIMMVLNLRASILITSLLPIAVLMVFIAMRYFGVDANIVALSGIAIAIGTMVDLGIVLSENVIKHIKEAPATQKLIDTIYNASTEVGSAIVTAVSTTIVSFVPVFTMEAAEGKLFRPLAFTKTFALVAALIVALLILPTLAHWFFGIKINKNARGKLINALLILGGLFISIWSTLWGGLSLMAFGAAWFVQHYSPKKNWWTENLALIVSGISVTWLLANYWMPLGAGKSLLLNFIFVTILLIIILGSFSLLERYYAKILNWCLEHKMIFLFIPTFLILLGGTIWIGFNNTFGFLTKGFDTVGLNVRTTSAWSGLSHTFPGIGKEFMPSLDEGSYLLMPTSMPHAGIEQNKRVVQQLDMLLANIP
ncbi:MAG: efflux RND transporter permease subunit, partial [Cyclobacteriaceae bacterium]|nr:efflux RND transporter permease subunit [Cyclobacteriaceae bacterium]